MGFGLGGAGNLSIIRNLHLHYERKREKESKKEERERKESESRKGVMPAKVIHG